MTPQEMIAVIKAYEKGKKIECCYKGEDEEWGTTISPTWDFFHYEYRVKPEPKYRPFEKAEEVMEAINEHGSWVCSKNDSRLFYGINGIGPTQVKATSYNWVFFSDAFDAFTFVDGTPFGKLEE